MRILILLAVLMSCSGTVLRVTVPEDNVRIIVQGEPQFKLGVPFGDGVERVESVGGMAVWTPELRARLVKTTVRVDTVRMDCDPRIEELRAILAEGKREFERSNLEYTQNLIKELEQSERWENVRGPDTWLKATTLIQSGIVIILSTWLILLIKKR